MPRLALPLEDRTLEQPKVPKGTPEPEKEEWVRCPVCTKKLAKRVGPGQYEVKNKGRPGKDGQTFRQVIYAGTVFCARCGHGAAIPPLKVASRPSTTRRP